MDDKIVRTYQDLRVWQQAMDLTVDVYAATKQLPASEQFGLVAQMRRAAVSVPSNIAEGFGRETAAMFAHFLRTAQGSLKELETQLLLCRRLELLDTASSDAILEKCDGVGKMLGGLMRSVTRKTNYDRRTTNDSSPKANQ